MSCPPAWNNSSPTGLLSMKFDILRNVSRNFSYNQNQTVMTGTIHGDRCTFFIVSRLILLRMTNVSDNSCRESQNIHFVFNKFLFQ